MRSLTLDRHRKARIWLGSLPDALYAADEVLAFTALTAGSASGAQRIAAIELMTPLGGRIMYALLGGHFTPDQSTLLHVSINVTNRRTARPFKGSLVESVDDVRVGLPAEFANGVAEGVHMALETNHISGKVLVNCAAHAAVGSSIVAFRRVARSLVHLFCRASSNPDDAELISFL